MAAIKGFVGFYDDGTPLVNTYNQVLLWKTPEDARGEGAVTVKQVVGGKVRKRAAKPKNMKGVRG